jgi:DNA-binding CsgD family transcriptional regulator
MPETLAGHIRNIVDKLQTNDRTHAVTIGLRVALLELE